MKYAAAVLMLVLGACSREPRDVSWFEANPAEAEKVVAACATGARSNECENARTGLSRVKANARMERYRKGFE